MKTTKTFRLLAVLLALMLAFGAMPALAVEIDSGDYAAWTQSAVDDLYGRLMAAENYEDYIAIVETLGETACTAFFNALTEEQQAALEEHSAILVEIGCERIQVANVTDAGPLVTSIIFRAPLRAMAISNALNEDIPEGLIIDKTATKNTDDSYTITLESYVTGNVTTTTEVQPVDIVLVLDVSGSMNYCLEHGKRMGLLSGHYYCTSRISALEEAVNSFIDQVAKESEDNKVANRIAIVSFNSNSSIEAQLQDTSTANGVQKLKKASAALRAGGDTDPAKGLADANSLLNNSSNQKVIVLFTDGYPAGAGTDNINYNYCDNAISESQKSKAKNTTVYTIGVFNNADPDDTIDDYSYGSTNNTKQRIAANRYMNLVSSNYPSAKSMKERGERINNSDQYYLTTRTKEGLLTIFDNISKQISSGKANVELGKDTFVTDVISQSFTVPGAASDITAEIIECASYDGTTATWDENKRTPIDGKNISVNPTNRTVSVTGFDYAANFVSQNGYDENDRNKAGDYHGAKLRITFTVTPQSGFLGGNDVFTNVGATISNGDNSYSFPQPTVNVPIKNVTVTAQDKNVYLLGEVTADQLKTGATVKVGDVALDLSKDKDAEKPYGLETWQTEYVNITVAVKDKNGTAIPTNGLKALTDDTTYTISVTVAPKTNGSTTSAGTPATEKSGENSPVAKINVFKPELTFKDSTVEYKKSVLTLNSQNYADIKAYFEANNKVSVPIWKHGNTKSTDVTMTGTEPTLDLTYTPESGKIVNNIVESTTDIPVKVEAKIGTTDVTNKTTFVHQCDVNVAGGCQWNGTTMKDGNPAFLLHVIKVVGDLTITKTGLNQHTYTGEKEDQESAIFKVEGDNQTWYVAINANANGTGSVTLTGLKVGDYTVTELTDWTWRYGSSTLTSDDQNTDGTFKVNGGQTTTVTCANSNHNDKWLGGDNYANNVFAGSNTPATD